MATNPSIPPEQRPPFRVVEGRREQTEVSTGRRFPWGLFGAIVVLICIAFIAYFIFR